MAVINGTNSSETLVGTSNSDTITGFGGNDTLTGGAGLDSFIYTARQFGADTITDFVQGQDRVDLSALGWGDFSQIQPFITQVGTGSR
ncbi:hypothetical protein IP81_15580, partial [Novosphingobium sp. AAP83]|uniref:M10 family metallopeptidase C-terminal domain-containing protein n=1 Tax=Novosphingobium sp. AAP83 TaxID=1523425 RepID=UPI0006CCE126